MMASMLPMRPACADDAGSWCARFYDLTSNDTLSRSADTIVATTMQITLVVVLALIARLLLHRLITRVIERVQDLGVLAELVVATDSSQVADAVRRVRGRAVLTRDSHQTGTDRVAGSDEF